MRRNTFIMTLLFCLQLFISCGKKDKGFVEEEHLDGNRIVETGELAAIDSRSFVMPRFGRNWYQMKIIGLLKHGTQVKTGDSIIQLDPTEIKKSILERETELETQLAVLAKMYVDQSNRRNDLNSQLQNEIASFNLNKLELESSRFESDRIRKIKDLEFKQAKITLNRVKRVIELNKVMERNDLKIQKIRIKQLRSEIKDAYKIIPSLTLRTPISGIFQVANNRRTGEMIKVGDDVYQGGNIGNVPDLKWMKVNTYINENDFLKLKAGQEVAVRLDALPKVSFDGKITYIGKLCHLKDQKSRQKVFDVEVSLLKPDERLKPGMTVSCEFLQK